MWSERQGGKAINLAMLTAYSQDEILALQADDNKAGSPSFGPPPVSRMLRDEMKTNEASSKPPVGIFDKAAPASKAKAAEGPKPLAKSRPAEVEQAAKAQNAAPSVTATSQSLVSEKKAIASKTPALPPAPVVSAAPIPTTTTSVLSASASAKSGGKRKFAVNDENAALRGIKAGNENNKPQPTTHKDKDQTERTVSSRELKNPRSIRSQVNNRKEAQEDPVGAKESAPIRQPLAAKSTNKDISTPQKQALNSKEKPKDNNSAPSAGKPTEATGRMRNRTKMTVAADLSGSSLLETVDVHLDNDKASRAASSEVQRERKQPTQQDPVRLDFDKVHLDEPEMDAACPSTPPLPSSTTVSSQGMVVIRNEGRDTPPPADISSQGEVSRPSRRSRTSVSYAEPNLRDKMRRPTKELFDAVAGEGKYVQRHSLQPHNSQDQDEDNGEHVAVPSSDKTESSAPANSHQQMTNASSAAETIQRHTPTDQDPYEFTLSSSSSPQEADEESESLASKNRPASSGKKGNSKSYTKGSRRASLVTAPRDDDASTADRHTRPPAPRKRASMASTKRGSLLDSDEEDQADSSYEPSAAESTDTHDAEGRSALTRERISRRRSMML